MLHVEEEGTMSGMQNKFKETWDRITAADTLPRRLREIHEIDFEEFRAKVVRQDPDFVESIPQRLYAGDAYFLRGAFQKDFLIDLARRVHEYCKRTPSSFHKMVEGCPDFHRIIDAETGKKYSFRMAKHSCYFYPWNGDPLQLFKPIYERWRLIKFLSGQRPDEYEKNTPRDGVVDRIQVVRYPSGAGMLETHSDPYLYQPLIISTYMSKRGEDFERGGFYMMGADNRKVDMENMIGVGDMLIAYATVLHGVDVIDPHKEVDWDSVEGRWFLSLYSNASDEIQNRHTGYAVKVEYEG